MGDIKAGEQKEPKVSEQQDYGIKPVLILVPKLPNGNDPTLREKFGYEREIYGKAISAGGLRYKFRCAADLVDDQGRVTVNLSEQYSGIVISGGDDFAPEELKAPRHRKTDPADQGRDKEPKILIAAMKEGLPVIGICRGMQVIVAAAIVATGEGRIEQHLPDYLGKEGGVVHNAKAQLPFTDKEILRREPHRALAAAGPVLRRRKIWDPRTWGKGSHFLDRRSGIQVPERQLAPGHVVEITPGSAAAKITGVSHLRTNAWHHQGIFENGLAPGVLPVGRTRDGVVEMIELSRELIHKMTSGRWEVLPFLLGVQWHPEALANQYRPHAAILSAFCESVKLTARFGPKFAAAVGPHSPLSFKQQRQLGDQLAEMVDAKINVMGTKVDGQRPLPRRVLHAALTNGRRVLARR